MYFQVNINFQVIPPTHEGLAAHLSFLGGQEYCTAIKSMLLYLRQKTWTGRNAVFSGIVWEMQREGNFLPPAQIQGLIQMTKQAQLQFCSFCYLMETIKLLCTIQLEICTH